ncbi:hypothetical protein PLICRDRAFT_526239 [Plicaturopsis crispa FD-325 SS-3]|nr:hypothetical protein PLICRDRAFT_526239 [Plicaturopsis crispa FD-325 SS-3]
MRGSCVVRRDIPPMHSPRRCSQVAAVDCYADTCMLANTVCLCRLRKRQARPSVSLPSPPQPDPVVKWQSSPYRKQLDGQIRLRYRTSSILWSTSRCGCWRCKREACPTVRLVHFLDELHLPTRGRKPVHFVVARDADLDCVPL